MFLYKPNYVTPTYPRLGFIEEIFADYNDINYDIQIQLKLINQKLAELQIKKKFEEKPRRKIGYIQHDE